MDGYIWLYEELYGDKLLDRLERNWRWRTKPARLRGAKAYVGARLGARALAGDAELRSLYRRSIRMMVSRHLRADPGQLLLTLDATDFARFMRRFRSANYAANAAAFEAAVRSDGAQWDNTKARSRSATA